jgi:methylated-DNA-[protein]-cysteine S-methyltransferase
MSIYYDRFDTPIGPLTVAADENGVRHILFAENRHDAKGREHWQHDPDAVAEPRRQLLEYLQGKRRHFDLILAPAGTDFQLDVWQMLAQIPFGATWSYKELAERIGKPTATRAVGAANGRNPLPIVLPCHRVIGNNGALTGFGGGLPTKVALLKLEGVQVDEEPVADLFG